MTSDLYLDFRPPAVPDLSGLRVLSFCRFAPGPDLDGSEGVVVYLDYENLRLSFRSEFGVESGHFSPIRLAKLVVDRRRRPSHLLEVRIYRTLSDPVRNPGRARDDVRRAHHWLRSPNTVFIGRQLRYHRGERPREKGIDISLTIDAIIDSQDETKSAAILGSRDSDFEPLIETLYARQGWQRHIEVIGVEGMTRVTMPNTELPWCHFISREDFDLIRED